MTLLTKLSVVLLASLPAAVLAQEPAVYKPLVNILGGETPSFNEYINLLYTTSISLAALLAVVKIIIAGAKYMLSDVINTKGEALSEIKGALLGLLLIVGAYVILNVINPQLLENDLTGNFNTIPVGTPPVTRSLETMATPPVMGNTDLLEPLDFNNFSAAERRAEFERYSANCTSQGGLVMLGATPNIRNCRNIERPAVISGAPGSPESGNPIAPAVSSPTIIWTREAQGSGGVAVLQTQCTSGNYNKLEFIPNVGYSCIAPRSVTNSVSNGLTGILAGYECPNGGELQSSTAIGEGLERFTSSSRCVSY